MTRIAEHAPVACASCGGQYVDRRHVDFDAAWDGPVINQLEGVTAGVTFMQVDELVVCEECLREAFRLLEYDDLSDEEKLDQAHRISALEAMNRGQARYIDQLERTVAEKKQVPAEPARPRGQRQKSRA